MSLDYYLVTVIFLNNFNLIFFLLGPTLDGLQQTVDTNHNTTDLEAPKVILVFFIGGCTFAEISALRFLSQQEEYSNIEFVIATTKLNNGDTFLKSIIESNLFN